MTPGEETYAAYAAYARALPRFPIPMVQWPDLSERERHAWEAAAEVAMARGVIEAVADGVVSPVDETDYPLDGPGL